MPELKDVEHEAGADTPAVQRGYERGFEGGHPWNDEGCQYCYTLGYMKGAHDRDEVQRSESSNT